MYFMAQDIVYLGEWFMWYTIVEKHSLDLSIILVTNGAVEFFNVLTDFLLSELLPFHEETHPTLSVLLDSVPCGIHTVFSSVVGHIYDKVCYTFLEYWASPYICVYNNVHFIIYIYILSLPWSPCVKLI